MKEGAQFYVDECFTDFSKVKQIVNSLSFMMVFPIDGSEFNSRVQINFFIFNKGEEDTVFFELKVYLRKKF